MIIMSSLPELATPSCSPTEIRHLAFELIRERENGNAFRFGPDQEVDVVGHKAVGKDKAALSGLFLFQNVQCEFVQIMLHEGRLVTVRPDGYETYAICVRIEFGEEPSVCWRAVGFVPWHGYSLSQNAHKGLNYQCVQVQRVECEVTQP